MNRVDRAFRGVRSFAGDVWVADYTEQTRYKPEEDRKGVVISEADPGDIGTFHLQNDCGVAFWGVNFEENKDFFPEGVQDCECMFKAKNVTKGGWLLLCELKYNLDKDPNNEQNAEKALGIADRAYVLTNGVITHQGTGAELAGSEEIKKAYLGG